MQIAILLIVSVILAGCAQNLNPAVKNYNNIYPGLVQTRNVGESLFETGTIEVATGFRAKRDCHVPLMEHLLFPFIKRGDIWICDMRLKNGNLACSSSEESRDAVESDKGGKVVDDVPRFVLTPEGSFKGLYFASGQGVDLDGRLQGLFEPVEIPMVNMTRHELVYKGKQADSIKLDYKEFTRDPATPDLLEKLNYDIASLNVIQVKDVIIQVLDASDSAISYIIKN